MTPRVTLESLAVIVKQGFEDIIRRMETQEQDMAEFRAEVKTEFERVDLRLSHAAYRFELVELEHRVGDIERQIGIPQK